MFGHLHVISFCARALSGFAYEWNMHCRSVQLSWYSHILILDTNKTSGYVSFNLNLDLNLETSMWKHLLELEWSASAGEEFTFY